MKKTISVTVPVTFQVDVILATADHLPKVNDTVMRTVGEAYLQELIAEQLYEAVNETHFALDDNGQRYVRAESTDVKADVANAVITVTDN